MVTPPTTTTHAASTARNVMQAIARAVALSVDRSVQENVREKEALESARGNTTRGKRKRTDKEKPTDGSDETVATASSKRSRLNSVSHDAASTASAVELPLVEQENTSIVEDVVDRGGVLGESEWVETVNPWIDAAITRLLHQKQMDLIAAESTSTRGRSPDSVLADGMNDEFWEELTTTFNAMNGGSMVKRERVRLRVEWLLQVLQDPSHPEHGKLSDRMKLQLGYQSSLRLKSTTQRAAVVEEEEETKDGGDDNSRKEAAVTPLDDVVPETGFVKGQVYVTSDEKMMRLLLENATRLATATRRMPVWSEIANAFPSAAFKSGRGVQQRVIWLMKVLKNRYHSEHGRLTPKLREMLTECYDHELHSPAINRKTMAAEPDVTRRKKSAKQQQLDEDDEDVFTEEEIFQSKQAAKARDDDDDYVPSQPKTPPKSKKAITAPSSESEHAITIPSPESKKTIINPSPKPRKSIIDASIDENFMHIVMKKIPQLATAERKMDVYHAISNDLNGRFKSGWGVRTYLTWLLKVASTPLHDQHGNLTAKLKTLLNEYKSIVQVIPEYTNNPKSPTSETTSVHAPDKDKVVVEEAQQRLGKRKMSVTFQDAVVAKRDEQLVRLVLKKQPFFATSEAELKIWDVIAKAMTDINSKIRTGSYVKARFYFLVDLVRNGAPAKKKDLTNSLLKMIKKYIAVKKAHDAKTQRNKATTTDDESEAEDDTADSESKMDTALLRATLRIRPFHGKPGTRMSIWDSVAADVHKILGEKSTAKRMLPNGQKCFYRVRRLLGAVESRYPENTVQLTPQQREMAGLVGVLMKVEWPEENEELTPVHREWLEKIVTILDGKTPSLADSGQHSPKRRKVAAESTPSTQTTTSEGELSPVIVRLVPRQDRLGKPRQNRTEKVCQDKPEKPRQDRTEELVAPSTAPTRLVEVAREPSVIPAARKVVQSLTTVPRDSVVAERGGFETQLQALREELSSQLKEVMDKLEQERKEHRGELQQMMDMLKAERDVHHRETRVHQRETSVMLEVIQKEREDRREEFVAMMNLVTRSVLQQQRHGASESR